MITATGLVTRGLVEGLGAAGLASRGLVTAITPGLTPAPGPTLRYQPRHWIPVGPLRWRNRVP